MSYILDALRKSDQQRQRGAPPTLLAPQATVIMPGRRVSVTHVVLAALLIGAGIAIGALRPWQSEPAVPAKDAVTVKPLEPGPGLAIATQAVLPPAAPPLQREMPAQKTAQAARSAPAAAVEPKKPQPAVKPAAKTQQPDKPLLAATPKETAKPAPSTPDGTGASDAAQEQKVMTLSELPVSIQQEMPKLSISVHAYSSIPRERLWGVNDRMLREGDYVVPGLLLEQITPDGVIMSYKGYRFRRGVR